MTNIPTHYDINATLRSFVPKTSLKENYTLDRMRTLLGLLGNPQNQLKVIHIAGTSGKTSTAYFIRGLLQKAGKRTGLTISPHIVAINERIQLDGVPLSDARFAEELDLFMHQVAATKIAPTYYELLMAFAYWFFAKEGVDYAIIETGLGGLLDGSNVVNREDKLCVICDIGLEHTEILGTSIEEIAAQKAGIIQAGNHLVTSPQPPRVARMFSQRAKEQGATIEYATRAAPLPGLVSFQQRNLALALTAYHHLAGRDNLPATTAADIQEVSSQVPPGRFERYHIGDKTVILDGAHNPQKLAALGVELANQGLAPLPTLMGFVSVPEYVLAQRIAALAPICSKLFITEFSDQQDQYKESLPAHVIAEAAKQAGVTYTREFSTTSQALRSFLAQPQKTLLITGSIYLIRQIRPMLNEVIRK
ncbi:MAG: Folylpolyglutamate synthase/dihydrofolate synthase [Patescibacteria group bacterium]|nr:Folylpolyglutamate synthase/dihydrofolate synthase [Patescibacteria group bacterium]